MTGASLLQAILDHPDDDDLRLIYADWLDDHDEGARAEFIRVQCQLVHAPSQCGVNWPPHVAHCSWRQLRRRERELLEEHGFAWLRADMPLLAEAQLMRSGWRYAQLCRGPEEGWFAFRRGFAERVDHPPRTH